MWHVILGAESIIFTNIELNKQIMIHNLEKVCLYMMSVEIWPKKSIDFLLFYDNFHRLNENEVRATTMYAYFIAFEFELWWTKTTGGITRLSFDEVEICLFLELLFVADSWSI